ncbi:MATE family efflux transporter [Emticicia sp. W12TSBA100-4]|uniref:MATE family efflux transporter n=1 Tax=Emticicia sp. W12TSBA100-4 TaxID=3160965 RepID=UPI0033055F0D
MQAAKKVTVNTAISYFRLIITVVISFYSTRLVLNSLGAIDYGIFNLISGVVAMLSFLNVAMSTSTQRFFSYYHGSEIKNVQKKIFTNSVVIHLIIAIIVVVILELSGLFLISNFLKIPESRIDIALKLFHFMGLSVFFTIVSVPFTALLNAHENLIVIAIVNILEAIFKILIALTLDLINIDKLLLYGILINSISIVSTGFYLTYCIRKYEECTLIRLFEMDKVLVRKLLSFAGWNLFGSICFLGRTQGIAVLLNLFHGAVVNAAYGISNQVSAQMNYLSVSMLQSLNPQIMKSEGMNDRERVLRLSMMACKFSYFLFAFIAIPSIVEMDEILSFWLNSIPIYSSIFCSLLLVGMLINQLTIGIQSGLQAVGKIKHYQFIVGTLILLNLPISFILLSSGYEPYFVFITFIFIEILACCIRLLFLKKEGGLDIMEYVNRVLLKISFPTFTIIAVALTCRYLFSFPNRFIVTFLFSISCFVISILLTGLYKDEKELLENFILKFSKGRKLLNWK